MWWCIQYTMTPMYALPYDVQPSVVVATYDCWDRTENLSWLRIRINPLSYCLATKYVAVRLQRGDELLQFGHFNNPQRQYCADDKVNDRRINCRLRDHVGILQSSQLLLLQFLSRTGTIVRRTNVVGLPLRSGNNKFVVVIEMWRMCTEASGVENIGQCGSWLLGAL